MLCVVLNPMELTRLLAIDNTTPAVMCRLYKELLRAVIKYKLRTLMRQFNHLKYININIVVQSTGEVCCGCR